MCNVVNKHNMCNLAHCARHLQSLNHAVSGDYIHTLILRHTDTHTSRSSRTHFVSCCKKQAKLNVSASSDDLTITITVIIGNDRVVCLPCVFTHSSPQLHSTSEGADLQSWSSRCGCRSNPAWSPTPDLYPALVALHM